MSFELTPALILTSLGALSSLLVATWALSRRSRDWDEAERLRKLIDGEPDKEKAGLLRELHELRTRVIPELQDAVATVTSHVRWLKYGLGAHGSEEHVVIAAVRDSIATQASEMAKVEIARVRKSAEHLRKLLRENQDRAFERTSRDESSFVDEVLGRIDAPSPPSDVSSDQTPEMSPPSPPIPRPRPRLPEPRERESWTGGRPDRPDERTTDRESRPHPDRESRPSEPRDGRRATDTGRYAAIQPPRKPRKP